MQSVNTIGNAIQLHLINMANTRTTIIMTSRLTTSLAARELRQRKRNGNKNANKNKRKHAIF